jgi:hypothetical protein
LPRGNFNAANAVLSGFLFLLRMCGNDICNYKKIFPFCAVEMFIAAGVWATFLLVINCIPPLDALADSFL